MSSDSPIPRTIGNYNLVRQIGKGSFATVWKAEHKLAKLPVAVKVIENAGLASEDAQTRFVREVNLIKQMDHPFIAKLFEVIKTQAHTYLIMEFAESGSILTYVNSNGRLPERQARRYFSQLISALEYLHDEKLVAHRDLKAENVLLDRNLNIRLIDFGLSNSFTDEAPELTTACGSPAYASPEMVRGHPYTKAADVWSSGVLLYAMVTGRLPFDDDNMQRLLQKIAFTEPQYPSYLSPQLIDLLKKVMMKNPDFRLTIPKIKSHPWFSQSEYSRFLQLQFSSDAQWLVAGVDKEIVGKIASFGVDVKALPQALLCGEYNELTAIYWILRREQITDKIKEMMMSLNEVNTQKGTKLRRQSSQVVGNDDSHKPACARNMKPIPVPVPRGKGTPSRQMVKPPTPGPAPVPVPVPMGARRPSDEASKGRVPIPIPTPQKTMHHEAPKGPPKVCMLKRGRVNSLIVK